MTSILIVDDGQYTWGGDAAELRAAAIRLGWAIEGRMWREPESRPSDCLGDEPYTLLCATVQPAIGYSPDDSMDSDWSDMPSLTYRPDLGRGVWEMN